MDLSVWVLYTFIAALAVGASVAHYRWREPDGRGRTVLGLMRGAALGLIVLLLFDPIIAGGAGSERPVVALIDASLSMTLAGEDGRSRWARARELAAASAADRVQLFGSGEERWVSQLAEAAPTAARSRLAPDLRAVLEAGVGGVLVITDGAVEDAAEVRRIVAGSSIPVEVRTVGVGAAANLSLEGVDAPRWLEVGEPAVVRFTVARSGSVPPPIPDSVVVALRREGRELARARVPAPARGRGSSGELRFRPESAAEGAVRLEVRIEPGGAVADDDVRSLYVRIAEAPAGVAVVSLRPDQEPRFLIPVLERALALPVRGWIALSEDRFLGVGTGREAGVVRTGATVRRAVAEASLVVLHGVDSTAPAWARAVIGGRERLLVFPSDPAPPLPVPTAPYREGDWYVVPEVPSSPVAALLAGTAMAEVPPLMALRPVALPDGYWTPLVARLGRRGEAHPVAAVGTSEGRRVAVALGEGYWRWAFGSPEGRDVYERFWSAVAGWLSEELDGLEREAIRPSSRVVERGARVGWTATEADDSVMIRIHRQRVHGDPVERAGPAGMNGTSAARAPEVDTTVAVESGRAFTGSLPPGHYRYVARTRESESEGAFTVESYSAEFLDAPAALDDGVGGTGEGGGIVGGRPLRASSWPYILVVALLCAEWVLRRRWGLR